MQRSHIALFSVVLMFASTAWAAEDDKKDDVRKRAEDLFGQLEQMENPKPAPPPEAQPEKPSMTR